MIPGFGHGARIALWFQVCAVALAFQISPEGPLEIAPRTRPGPAALAAETQPSVRVDASLVLIPVHVITTSGVSVTNLKKEDFVLSEDGVRQTITHFAQDDAPLSAGVLLDISGSMKNKMGKASEAAGEFFKFANPEDEFFLVEFNGRPKLKVPFTQEWAEICRQISQAKASGLTALLDAIHLGIAQMKHARNGRKALIILSDGGDNFSRRNLRELTNTLIESNVQVYAMGLYDGDYSFKHTPEERNGPRLLDEVALNTGGRDFPVTSLDNLPSIGVQIARELRNQYILGYSPTAITSDGKFHRVNLKLAAPDTETELRAFYRRGYYAPAQ
jgi:VWFA-related protein